MAKTTSWTVYWLYDDTCSEPSRDGYIGCCERLDVRLRAHRRAHGTYKSALNVPTDFKVAVLFVGSEKDSLDYEQALRPHPHIGWNIKRGGGQSCRGTKQTAEFKRACAESAAQRFKGIAKPVKQREKMSEAGSNRYADRKRGLPSYERARLAKNAKRAARRAAGLPRLY